jgi:DNA-binding CsgD family transcriptional regulator
MPRKLSAKTLTDAQLEELVTMGLTDSELSHLLGISESTFKTRYPSAIRKGRARLRHSLRRAQIKSALAGNSTMLVWLGKVYLGQRDHQSLDVSAEDRALSITPKVLERLRTSYKLTMDS